MFEATTIIQQNSDWVTLVLLFIFSVLAISKLFFTDKIYYVTTFFFSKKHLSILFNRDKNNIFTWFQGVFFIVQILIVCLVLFIANSYFNNSLFPLNFNNFLQLLILVTLYFCARYLVGFLLAFLFDAKQQFVKLAYQKTSYMNTIVLWIFPFVISSIYIGHYSKLIVTITLVIFVLLLLLRYIFVLVNNKKLIFNNLFYFILYLCALEIAPLIIILKLTI